MKQYRGLFEGETIQVGDIVVTVDGELSLVHVNSVLIGLEYSSINFFPIVRETKTIVRSGFYKTTNSIGG